MCKLLSCSHNISCSNRNISFLCKKNKKTTTTHTKIIAVIQQKKKRNLAQFLLQGIKQSSGKTLRRQIKYISCHISRLL